MKTRVPNNNLVPEIKPRDDDRVRQVRRYKLITPLFGGGVEPNKADPITIVRGTGVRGHLRFWWRATRGGQFNGDLEDMRKAEEAIWGSAVAKDKPRPSNVIISVEILNRGKPFQAVDNKGKTIPNIGDVKSIYSYVAFPLRDDTSNPPVLQDVEFELTICYPSKWKQDVEAALWAWEIFGGLGARTRRGFGALQLTSIDGKPEKLPNIEQFQTWVSNGLKTHVISGRWPEGVPHLTPNVSFVLVPKGGKANTIEAWRYLTDKLKTFRQWRPDKSGRPYGRSKWPEADEVRRLTGTASPGHSPSHPVHKFPRGQFGLPIIFHFKDENRGDPSQTTLQGGSSDRFASALILRPLGCADGAVGLALRLVSPKSPPGGYVLKSGDQADSVEVYDLSPSEANQIEPLNGQTDVLQALFNFLKK